jgi:hypothetical protein
MKFFIGSNTIRATPDIIIIPPSNIWVEVSSPRKNQPPSIENSGSVRRYGAASLTGARRINVYHI